MGVPFREGVYSRYPDRLACVRSVLCLFIIFHLPVLFTFATCTTFYYSQDFSGAAWYVYKSIVLKSLRPSHTFAASGWRHEAKLVKRVLTHTRVLRVGSSAGKRQTYGAARYCISSGNLLLLFAFPPSVRTLDALCRERLERRQSLPAANRRNIMM